MTNNKRMYFACAIKALYMQKEFGVRFEVKHLDCEMKEYDLDEKDIFYPFDHCSTGEPQMIGELCFKNFRNIYVAKESESESIFLPKFGDEGRWPGKLGAVYANYNGSHWCGQGSFNENEVKIIMRDNKHFLDCEVESD